MCQHNGSDSVLSQRKWKLHLARVLGKDFVNEFGDMLSDMWFRWDSLGWSVEDESEEDKD